ncbi:MAG: hypothetical protein ACRDSP_19425 [Pseudonocardiaceae bacterium]
MLPFLAGLDTSGTGPLGPGFGRAMLICAGLCVLGGIVACQTIDRTIPVTAHLQPGLDQPCQQPSTRTVGQTRE